MPHFFASKLDSISLPAKIGDFSFQLEAKRINGEDSIILVDYKNYKFLLTRLRKDSKILVKYNKSLKFSSKAVIKLALKEYAKLTNADIISHNLSSKSNLDSTKEPHNTHNPYFLNISNIKDILESSNIIIEVGFGSGQNILNMAKNNPRATFIGLEIYRPAIEQVLKQIKILGLKNLFIMNADCRILFDILPSNKIDAIYLHFPVPWDKNEQKRVFSKSFLQKSLRILKKGAFLELRTDSKEYFDYALNISKDFELKIESVINSKNEIISKYEARWLRANKNIYSASFYKINDYKEGDFSIKDLDLSPFLAIDKILDSNIRLANKEYFLHIKSVYKFKDGHILFILFGAYYAPNHIFLIIYDNKLIEVLGDIIPTYANISSLNLISGV
ncbi:MAG: tRNA (guanosine(46)-N7)-methyltransferase TrmB [Helicobacteraceae bacterium]|nr:tRNA (guanosine(46)-N7)-methyltransferase TrmB [Helicobacteraceae bacterium]